MTKPTKPQLELLNKLAGPHVIEMGSGDSFVSDEPWPYDSFRANTINNCIEKGWVKKFFYSRYLHGAVKLTEQGMEVFLQYGAAMGGKLSAKTS